MKARLKITDAMVDAGLDAFIDYGKETGRVPPDAAHDDFLDIDAARKGMRRALQAAAGVCLQRSGYGGAS
ncbi:hypothetical protein [Roseibium sediminicola]|uniref:Uncharacterized protein n=1 Tax=Roseibium sediminicola TaxID=2933272 RepID=A0ABT0H0K1_9HYPH|nr:hypothetical protein [Roseibium sp. CAU 1639]MCK7615209.1 hypothetical protein [Roseibium sp. CAU 1639]